MTDVVVIGAGLSGMTAAHRLQQAGVECVVLEAKERVGGRTWNVPLGDDGLVTDAGAMYVCACQEQIRALAAELGVALFEIDDAGDRVCLLDGETTTAPSLSRAARREVARSLDELEQLCAQLAGDDVWRHPDALALDAITLAHWRDERISDATARFVFDHTVSGWHAVPPGTISLLYALHYFVAAGGLRAMLAAQSEMLRFVDGSQSLALQMAGALGGSVRAGSPVRTVQQTNGGVVVRTDASAVEAARVVVALNPAASRAIHFAPKLGAGRALLADAWKTGPLIKACVVYDKPFWQDAGLSGSGMTDVGAAYGFIDGSPAHGGPGVLAAVAMVQPEGEHGGNHASFYADAEVRRAATLDVLEQCLGPQARTPLNYIETNWAQQPYSHGCQGGVGPAVMTTVGSAWRAPEGAVHWAGTETARSWTGWMAGAVEAGTRAANEVLEAIGRA